MALMISLLIWCVPFVAKVQITNSQPTTITVATTPFQTNTTTVTPSIGQSVELQCTGAGVIKQWYTTGSEVTATRTEVTIGSGNTRILAFSSFTPSYAGTYTCLVSSPGDTQTKTTYPVVLVNPSAINTIRVGRNGDPITPITITPTLSQPVQLECERTDVGKNWYTADGATVSPTSGELTTTSGTTRTLSISSFSPSHAKGYTCIVSATPLSTYPVKLETPPPLPAIPVPSQVQGVTLTGSGTSLIVSWTAVTGTDPKYVIGYVVRYSADRGSETDPPSDAIKRSGITATSTTLTGLQSGITYYVWVAAEILGAGVQGPYSLRVSNADVSSQQTTITVGRTGDQTTTITATPTIGQSVELQCTRTSAIKQWYTTGSEVAPTSNEISTSGGPTRILAFSSFTPSHAGTYSCEVRNNNNIDTTTYPVILATATSAMPSPTPPPRVKDVTVTRGVSDGSPSLTVSWTAVSGFGITYTVRYSTSSGTTTEPPSGASTMSGVTGTSTTLSGLTQGTMYYIWVAAVSSDGKGPYSTRVSETTFEAPQQIASVDVNRTLLIIEWSAPSSERTIQHYQVDYRVGTSGSWNRWSPNPTSTSVTLTGLQSGTTYQVRVRAVSDVGNGDWSNTVSRTTYNDLESINMSGTSSSISSQTLGAGIFGGVVVGLLIGAVISCVTTKIVWGAPNMTRCQKRSEQSKLKRSTDEDYEAPGIALDTNPSYDTVNTYKKVGESSK